MLLQGDAFFHLTLLDSDSVDSLVTDPPAGISFMGKEWDSNKGGRDEWVSWLTEVMRECYRVLKPGAHGLVWAIPRTSHWTATALENAGFEIRDVITHLFGSGFPKSLDISKAIDKAAGAEREIVGKKSTYRKPQEPNGWDCSKRAEFETAPATDAAKKWQGYGTALKPASEHWILIRKPLSEKTVVANVLKHGVGGVNIDGCRVEAVDLKAIDLSDRAPTGRFPANLILSHNDDCGDTCSDDCAVRALDEQSGVLRNGGQNYITKGQSIFGTQKDLSITKYAGCQGGASRFFYCAKASKSDKGADNKHPTVKSTKLMGYLIKLVTPQGGTVLDPFMGSGSTGVAAKAGGFNFIGVEQEQEFFEIASMRILTA